MKKILLTLSILSIVLITSCGKDDGGDVQVGLTGSINFNGKSYSISNGGYSGANSDNIFAAIFIMSDGDIDLEEETFDGSIFLSVLTLAEGTSFEPGNYSLSLTSEKFAGASVSIIDGDNQEDYSAESGTINITGSGNNYSLTFNLQFENDLELTGNVSGGFEVFDSGQ